MATPRTIVILTSNPAHREALERMIVKLPGSPLSAGSLEDIPGLARDRRISAVLLDGDDAQDPAEKLCRRLRRFLHPVHCAIIAFGATMDAAALVRCLEGGADDCWRLPFNEPVCLSYLRAILRRVTELKPASGAVQAQGIALDPATRSASLNGRPLALRSKEFDLLYLLVKRRGKTLTRETLMSYIWGTEYFGTTRTIDFHVSQLRRKLKASGALIETVAGSGYRFAARAAYRNLTGF